jgi:uncharacterized membrane protein
MISLIPALKQKNRLPLIAPLFCSLALSILLIVTRIIYTSSIFYIFLIWNLFLAFIPFAISSLMIAYEEKFHRKSVQVLFILVWLLFFPNAPYILTDLFHLKHKSAAPVWFDLVLVLSSAWNGLILGYLSLMDIQKITSKIYGNLTGWAVCIGALILSGFGIYLGRYLRWNSWDIVANPAGLFNDILSRVTDPFSHPRTYGMTLLYAVFLIIVYYTLKQMIKSYETVKSKT